MRIDKWLWAARFYKTRSRAQRAITTGKVIVNGDRSKASKEIKIGDTIDIRMKSGRWVVVVQQLNERRGPASVAQRMYEETAASKVERARQQDGRKADVYADSSRRPKPGKSDRRKLARLKQQGHL